MERWLLTSGKNRSTHFKHVVFSSEKAMMKGLHIEESFNFVV